MPVPRGSTATIRSRRLSVRGPSPTTPASAIARADHPEHFLRHRAIRVEVIGGVEIDGIEVHRVAQNFSRSMTFELSTSSAFNSSGVNVTNWPRPYS